jgi:hypothetical protein
VKGAHTPERPAAAAGGLGSSAGLVLLCGLALPVARGLAPPLFVLAGLVVLAHRFERDAWFGAARAGGWSAVTSRLPLAQRLSIAALQLLPLAVLCTVAARAAASIFVAFPAAIWALVPLALGTIAAVRVAGRGRAPLLVVLALAVPVAGVFGARLEAGGAEARGFAGSGPILGIHPFQSTAVIVDGHGPYDVPINDYVEPDGSRGYGPEAYAVAVERALHEIAARHFVHGPARARRAFADATVESLQVPAVRETLDREPSEQLQPRITVWSGTTGQRSRVQFVCPGKQDDPSGIPEEAVMNRMCPNKYISEASAGLGLTGRWAGYTEGRGNERIGLSRAMGWTRSDDTVGRAVVAREVRWGAWILLLAATGFGIAGVGARAGAHARPQAIEAAASAIFVVALVLAALSWLGSDASLRVAAFERLAAGEGTWSPRAWLPALVAFGGALGWMATGPAAPRRPWGRVPAAAIAAGTLAVGASVGADAWIRPDLAGDAMHLPLEAFVAAAAEAIGERMSLTILEIEGALAAVVLALLVAAVLSWTATAGAAAERLFPAAARGRLAGLLVPVIAAALVVSRKTDGAAALVPAAMAAIFVLASGLSLVARRQPISARSHRVSGARHVLAVAAAVWLAHGSLADLPLSPFVVLCSAIGLFTLLGGLVLLAAPRHPGPPGAEQPRDPP